MWKVASKFSIKLGGNTYINTNPVLYKGEPLFRFHRSEDGMLGIDFDVFDAGGKRVATFRKSILVQGDSKNYSVETGHDEYTVTEKQSGRVIVSVKRRGVEGAELEVSARLYTRDGFLFEATPTETKAGGLTMRRCVIRDCDAGIAVE